MFSAIHFNFEFSFPKLIACVQVHQCATVSEFDTICIRFFSLILSFSISLLNIEIIFDSECYLN